MAKSDWLLLAIVAVSAVSPTTRPIAIVLGILLAGILAHNITAAVEVVRQFDAAQHRAYSRQALATQERDAQRAASEAAKLLDSWTEKYGGTKLRSAPEIAECQRQSRETDYAQKKAEHEIRHLHMMIQANARVATGIELLGDAHSRVSKAYKKAIDDDLMDYLARTKAEREGFAAEAEDDRA